MLHNSSFSKKYTWIFNKTNFIHIFYAYYAWVHSLFNSFMTGVPVIWKPVHWFAELTFYMIGTSVLKELNTAYDVHNITNRSSDIVNLKILTDVLLTLFHSLWKKCQRFRWFIVAVSGFFLIHTKHYTNIMITSAGKVQFSSTIRVK